MRVRPLTTAAVFALGTTLLLAATASAATFRVTRADDPAPDACIPGDCSLREAVIAANSRLGSDNVLLPLATRYELTIANVIPSEGEDGSAQGDLDVDGGALTIRHRGRGRATIDANGLDRVLEVSADSATRLERLVLTGGANAVSGGTQDDGDGAAIRAEADLRIVESKLTLNFATGDGGAVHQSENARLVLDRSTIANNSAGGSGGALFLSGVERDQVARIRRSTIDGNAAAGNGGGIAAPIGIVRATSSTVSNNAAGVDGGGISIGGAGRLFLLNSTVAKNRANATGGGIRTAGPASINATTVARNLADADLDGTGAGAGLFSEPAGFELENSLIALNRLGAARTLADCAGGRFDSDGDNLLSGFPPGTCTGIEFVGDMVRRNPRIKGLARNHGETKTIALRRSSPAAGAAGPQSSPKRDQRHFKRDAEPDIGAYELGAQPGKRDRKRR